jgi:hypothetical protein
MAIVDQLYFLLYYVYSEDRGIFQCTSMITHLWPSIFMVDLVYANSIQKNIGNLKTFSTTDLFMHTEQADLGRTSLPTFPT